MKQLVEAFKSARKSEILIILICLCVLCLFYFGGLFRETPVATEEEKRIQRILSQIENAGSVEVMISLDNGGEPQGAVVVAPGAGSINVLLKLQQAVHTLTGLELSQIEVVESKR